MRPLGGSTVVLLVSATVLVALAGVAGYLRAPATGPGARAAGMASNDTAAATGTAQSPAGPGRSPPGGGPVPREGDTGRERVPEQRRAAAAPASSTDLRWPIWEFQLRQPIPPREPPLTPPPWRLVGATSSGALKQVIILRQGKTEPEFYARGDSLPGGYVVGEITDEDVTLLHGKRALLLSFIGIR